MTEIIIRIAERADVPAILRLYGQEDFDDGAKLTIEKAEKLFDRIQGYPNYHVYVALSGDALVGTFALLVMDHLGHRGAPSAVIDAGLDQSGESMVTISLTPK